MKKPTIKEQADKVVSRYGKTTGKSKGRKPAPKASVKVRPRVNLKQGLTGVKAQTTIRF